VKTVSDIVIGHSLAYLSVRKLLVGRPLLRENLANTDPPQCTTPIFNLFALLAPQP